MGGNFSRDWPVFFLLGLVVVFAVAVIINGNKQGKK